MHGMLLTRLLTLLMGEFFPYFTVNCDVPVSEVTWPVIQMNTLYVPFWEAKIVSDIQMEKMESFTNKLKGGFGA